MCDDDYICQAMESVAAGGGVLQLHCESGNIIADWSRQSHVNDIQQDDDQITLRYGYLDLARTIHLDASGHPENLVPTVEGHSIGRWEDNVLVVDTIGFLPRALSPRAEVMISGQTHILERFEYDEARELFEKSLRISDKVEARAENSRGNVQVHPARREVEVTGSAITK